MRLVDLMEAVSSLLSVKECVLKIRKTLKQCVVDGGRVI